VSKKGKRAVADSQALYFSVGDPVWFYDIEEPADPHPAPGVVTNVNGADYDVEITLADLSTRIERHVGPQEPGPSPSVRWIELRAIEPGGEL